MPRLKDGQMFIYDDATDTVIGVRPPSGIEHYFDQTETDLATTDGAGMVGWKRNATGAVARTVEDKLAEFPSIEDFSSAGGVNDQIQKAIDAVFAAGGNTLLARSASYSGLTTLTIPRGVVIRGVARNDGGYIRTKFIQDTGYVAAPLIDMSGTAASRLFGAGLENVTLYRANNATGSRLLRMAFGSFLHLHNVQIENGDSGWQINECWDCNFYFTIIRGQNTGLSIVNNEALGGTFFDNANNLKFFHVHAESFIRRGVEIIGSGAGAKSNNKIDFYSLKAEGAINASTFADAAVVYMANCGNVNFWGGHMTTKQTSTLIAAFPIVHFAGNVQGALIEGTNIANNLATPFDSAIKFSDAGSAGNVNNGIDLRPSVYVTPLSNNGICHVTALSTDATTAAVQGLKFRQLGFGLPTGTKLVVADASITNFGRDAPLAADHDHRQNFLSLRGRNGLLTGTAAAGAPNTITLDATAYPVSGQYNGWTITTTGGTGSGQTRTISSYASSRVATVDSNWTTTPDATTTYSLTYGDGQRAEPKVSYRHVGVPGYWEEGRFTENGRWQIANNAGLGAGEYGHLTLFGDYESTAGLKRCTRVAAGGAWDTGHLISGGDHVWSDGFGMLRHAQAAPTAATSGNPLGKKVAVPASATASGAPGQWAADTSNFYVYTGDGTTHTWRRVAIAAW